MADFVTFLFLFIVAQNLAFWFWTRDNPTRIISVSTSLATVFLIVLGVVLNARGIDALGFSGGRFLLLSPLAAMWWSVTGAAYRWHFWTQIMFVGTLVQIGIGLFDVGDANNIRWISVCSMLAVIAALGLLAYWANDWNKRDD